MNTFKSDIEHFEGNSLLDMFTEYKQQKDRGVFSGSCSDRNFPEDMDFKKWLHSQVQESIASEVFDI